MSSLSKCLAQAGDYLAAEHKAAILARAADLRASGMSATESTRQAVLEQHAEAHGRLSDVETAHAQGAELFTPHPAGWTPLKPVEAPMFAESVRVPTGTFDADGNPISMSANEHVAQARAEAADVRNTAEKLTTVAASCLLGVL